ncbi:hypothetical protein D3C73_824190 [compost metagenome]
MVSEICLNRITDLVQRQGFGLLLEFSNPRGNRYVLIQAAILSVGFCVVTVLLGKSRKVLTLVQFGLNLIRQLERILL